MDVRCGSHIVCGDPKEKETHSHTHTHTHTHTKIFLYNLEAYFFACLRSFPSGPQDVPQDPTNLLDISGERDPSEKDTPLQSIGVPLFLPQVIQ